LLTWRLLVVGQILHRLNGRWPRQSTVWNGWLGHHHVVDAPPSICKMLRLVRTITLSFRTPPFPSLFRRQ
jgi:hypothetical protein